ncbi:hypothetical protein [Chitinophaga rhizophila]|uniref:DUF4476 domain-containing protein n=1 Tax=Chitinophaga rhizophila TaxID=2866212 RepID=A0ABS7GLW5_9BACT|nr:hypothetical protein [Chitinophaga rhizophila]MBW8688396.1 hypothetical protein [Chitinophaga rhizophila]
MALHLAAQDQQYFVYIQSERSQPFYVRYDGKLLPSSDRGYLILSKMPAGTANLRIGFAKSDAPEGQYQINISGPADQGFLLKQDGSKGYSLFNLQTFAVIRPGEANKPAAAVAAAETSAPEVAVADTPAAAVSPETVAVITEATPAAVAMPSADTAVVPAPPVGVGTSDEDKKQAMMASLKKDLDSTFPTQSGVAVGPGTRPVKQTNKFSQALDRVLSDDRPDDIAPEQPQAPVATAVEATPAAVVAAAPAAETPRKKRRRRDREPLTEEEKQLASAILAEENKAAANESAEPVTDNTAPATAPASEVPASAPVTVPAEPVKEETQTNNRKERKQKKKKTEDPAFIDFMDTGGHQAPPAGTPVPAAVAETPAPAPVTIPAEDPADSGKKKKKRNKIVEKIDTIDTAEHPNNVVTDPTGYEVSDLSIDHPREKKKDRKKKKGDEEVGVEVAAPVAAPVADPKSSLKMINSDCGKVMDEETFRKALKKYAAGKDDDAMIDAFRKQTKGYCLESSQIRTLVQLLSSDESKYRLLDQAYPKAYHSDEFAGMESLLSDSYYKGRFRAMLHK